jgi:hypothetical protein
MREDYVSELRPHLIHESDEPRWNEIDKERSQRKTCHSATLSTTNPTWTDLGANPGLCGKRQATNCLSHDTAYIYHNADHVQFLTLLRTT